VPPHKQKLLHSLWDEDQDFVAVKKNSLITMVNGQAKWGVAFVKAYSYAALTKDESQLQHLLLIVAKHREVIPIQSNDAVLKNIIM